MQTYLAGVANAVATVHTVGLLTSLKRPNFLPQILDQPSQPPFNKNPDLPLARLYAKISQTRKNYGRPVQKLKVGGW